MDLDPLQDTLPPRYAIESEDSDDEQLTGPARREAPNVSLKYTGKLNANLLILAGQAGEQYGSGVRTTGSAIGSVHVDDVQVGRIQEISSSLVVASITHALPALASNLLARKLVETLLPSGVKLLDTYSVPIHISSKPIPTLNSQLKFLQTSSVKPALQNLTPLAPPNLIQSWTASVLPVLERRNIPGLVILLPSRYIPSPLPTARAGPQLPPAYTQEQFEKNALVEANEALGLGAELNWDVNDVGSGSGISGKQAKGGIDDSRMYI